MTQPQAQDMPTVPRPHAVLHLAALCVAAAAAAVSLSTATLLVTAHLRYRAADPLNSVELAEMKAYLAANAKDRAFRKEVRRRDLELRQEHFGHVVFARRGNLVLLACFAVFLASIRSAVALGKRLRPPRGKADNVEQQMRTARRARSAVVVLAALLGAGALSPVAVDAYLRMTTEPPPPPHYADPAEVARSWPRFRGPGGLGVSAYANVPTSWDGNSGAGIAWKTPVPWGGKGSPVVWKDRVFLSGATHDQRHVMCFHAGTGKLLWDQPVEDLPGSPVRPPKAWEETGHAAPTPVADDRHVFALFANGDLACFDHDGKLVWAQALGAPKNMYTHASSLVMYRHLLLVLWDQATVDDFLSKLLAFDGATGRRVWERRRDVANSWATPALIHDGQRHQLLTSANPWVISHDPATGQVLWKARCMEGGDVASSVTYADGIAYAVCAETKLWALRVDGSGDVTETHVAWSDDEDLPNTTSPLTDGKLVWTLTTGGLLTCYDAKSGEVAYKHDFEKVFNASPGLAGERVYLLTTKGVMFVIGAGREFKLLATSPLGEGCYASPAFQDGRIYLRAKKHLYCIANGKP
jgi:outer membrane protein assembly factor BamB